MSVRASGPIPEQGVGPASLWLFFFFMLLGPAWPEEATTLLLALSSLVFFLLSVSRPQGTNAAQAGMPFLVVAIVAFVLLMSDGELGSWLGMVAALGGLWEWHRQHRGRVRWTARAMQCAVALLVCLSLWPLRHELRDDVAYMRARLAHGPSRPVLREPHAMTLAGLEVGSIVQLQGRARCRPHKTEEVLAFDCRTLHWSDSPLVLPDPVPYSWLRALDADQILRSMGITGGPDGSPREVLDLSALWWPLFKACAEGPHTLDGFAQACEEMKQEVAAALRMSSPRNGQETWPLSAWEDALRRGQLRYQSVHVLASGEPLRRAITRLRTWVVHRRAQAMAQAVVLPQAGVSLRLGSDEAELWPRSFRVRMDESGAPTRRHADELTAAAAVQRLAAQAQGESFVLGGIVTHRQVDDQGHLTLTVDARRGPSDTVPMLYRLIAGVTAVLLFAWQGGQLLALPRRR